MESDLYEVMLACTEGRLADTPVSFTPGAAAATVVLAADGYPGKYPKGMPISGLEDAAAVPGVTVYHAGTKAAAAAGTEISVGTGGDGGVVSSGGRVLAVTGMGATFAEALDAAYRGVGVVKFSPCHYRKDIGYRAKAAPLRVGVLASGRGTALQAVIDSCEARAAATAAAEGSQGGKGGINAEVVLVVSNKKEAAVRERAKKHGIAEMFVSSKVRASCVCSRFSLLVGAYGSSKLEKGPRPHPPRMSVLTRGSPRLASSGGSDTEFCSLWFGSRRSLTRISRTSNIEHVQSYTSAKTVLHVRTRKETTEKCG